MDVRSKTLAVKQAVIKEVSGEKRKELYKAAEGIVSFLAGKCD